ncbi:MAG: rod shape-determining protein MreD [Gammaproteobacteria bacterium]|nr:rod shape-determining protein MreD [Gammaproteobacteria bacterium]
MAPSTRNKLVITASFIAAFILISIPGPKWADQFRPDWVSLVLIYWCLAIPQRVGVGVGWTVGLMLDVLYGSLLGQHALAKTIIAFLTLKLYLRVRMFPPWQQAFFVFLLLAINQLIILWIKGIIGQPTETLTRWTSIIVGMVVWPWLFVILRKVRRHYHVS